MCGGDVMMMMMAAGCLSSLIHQHTSLLSQQMMGHLCLSSAPGIAGPFLTRLLITPSGQGKSQSRESHLDWCCPTEDLLSGCQSDMWLQSSSCRHAHEISGNSQNHPYSLETHFRPWWGLWNSRVLLARSVCLWLHVRWWGVCAANADEVFLVVFPQANCPDY